MKILKLILLMLIMVTIVEGNTLSIISVDKIPNEVKPGDVMSLTIGVKNDGSEDIKNIRVSLDISEVPFVPIESSEKFLDKLRDGNSNTLTFLLRALPDAEPGIYKLPILIEADDLTTSFTSVTVKGSSNLDVGIEEGNLLILGERGELVIRFVNTGEGDLKFVRASIPRISGFDILGQDSFYIGNIEPDDFETVDISLILKEHIQAVLVDITYKDSFNNEYHKVVPLNVRTISQEEALQLGLIEKNNTASIIITVIVVLIVIFIYRKFKKR
jgi:uncharacterized membrane protein